MRCKRFAALLLIFLLLLTGTGCQQLLLGEESQTSFVGENELVIRYLDVGQGDSIFIELPDGKCMLIDASEAEYGKTVIDTVRALGHDRIDYVIATHPHSDHIGGMRKVLEAFEIGCIYLPDTDTNTNTYIKMAETILDRNIPAEIAQKGVVLFADDGLRAEMLAPATIDKEDQNRNSAVLLLQYGNKRFLFMGDADTSIEDSLGTDIRCDVLKVGHHGSRTASGSAFLTRANPTYAIISCGDGNSYGHPHQEVLERLRTQGAQILRTDELGIITVRSDGNEIRIQTGESIGEVPAAKWVLNTSTKKIHCPDCKNVKEIAERNYRESDATLAELQSKGYTPCGFCKPQE